MKDGLYRSPCGASIGEQMSHTSTHSTAARPRLAFGYNPRPMSDSPSAVVTRFAPSPTGELHVGGARTALFAWAYARKHSGRFLLRFEDTDQKRSSRQAEQNILRDLHWLGLHGDNETAGDDPGQGIPRQSQRLDLYRQALDQLAAAGHTYQDDGAVRFRMDRDVTFDDAVYGPITTDVKDLEDFVIQKADGFPTFHLAVVVDDIDMNVTHVIRGQEHLTNTAKHAALYDAVNQPRPIWCHTPSIMNPDGSKMSKRDKAKAARQALVKAGVEYDRDEIAVNPDDLAAFEIKENDRTDIAQAIADALGVSLPEINVDDFRRSGYLPEVLLNYLTLLGWNPGNDLERFDLNYFSQHFDFDRIGKSNSKFDREKLSAFSQDTFLQMPADQWANKLDNYFSEHLVEKRKQLGNHFKLFAEMYQERSKTLKDPAAAGTFFFSTPIDYQPKAVTKNLLKNDGEGLSVLVKLRKHLAEAQVWEAVSLHRLIDELWQELGLKNMGGVAQPLRVALTGNAVSPEIGPTLEVLGRDETLNRIDRCLDTIKA